MKIPFISIILILSIASCDTKKITKAVQQRVEAIKQVNVKETILVDSMVIVGNKKLKENKTDSIINLLFENKINNIKREKDSIQRVIKELEILIADKKHFKETYKDAILPKLKILENYSSIASNRMKIYLMLEEGLNVANFTLFDLAAFFGPGKYLIPLNKSELVIKSFDPMLDTIISFSNKFSNVPRTATLVILGFSDGEAFNASNNTNEKIKKIVNKKDATNHQLNQKLSELRAQELINILSVRFLKRSNEIKGFELFKIEYLSRGKGEQFPLPNIKDYREKDERRRVVICYWAVLPD